MTTDTPIAFQVLNEIGIINQLASHRFEKLLPDGLRLPHFTVLNHFVRLGGDWSPARLAGAFQVTKGAMTNTLQRLEARGLVAIRPDPRDGRAKIVSVTEKGRRVHADAIARVAPDLAEIQGAFGQGRFADALPFLRDLRAYLDKSREAD